MRQVRKIAGFVRDVLKRGLKMARSLYYFGRADVYVHGPVQVGIRSNIRVGRHCSVNRGVLIQGFCSVDIGENVVLSQDVRVLDANLDLEVLAREGRRAHLPAPVRIGDNCWLGVAAIVLPGVTLGPRTVVGAGSVVTKSFPGDVVVAGNPARVIRELSPRGDHELSPRGDGEDA